jgi:hypothetical protein
MILLRRRLRRGDVSLGRIRRLSLPLSKDAKSHGQAD